MHQEGLHRQEEEYSIEVDMPILNSRDSKRNRRSVAREVPTRSDARSIRRATPLGDDLNTSLDEALKRFRQACALKRVEKFYQDVLLAAIDELPDEIQADILEEETEAIGDLQSCYHLIVDSVEDRSGQLYDLSYMLEDFSHRKGLSLHELEQSLTRLSNIRECTVTLVEQLAQWRQRLKDFIKQGRGSSEKLLQEPYCDFIHRGKSVLEGLMTDCSFICESALEMYMNFERAGDPFFLNCTSKYSAKANPPPIRKFLRISKQDMVRMYQASAILRELLQQRKSKRQPRRMQTVKKSSNQYRSEQVTKQLLGNRKSQIKPKESFVDLNLSYLHQKPLPKAQTKSVGVYTIETRTMAVNTSNTIYRENESTQTLTRKPKTFTTIEAQTDAPIEERKPISQIQLISNKFPRLNRIQLVNPEKESSVDYSYAKEYESLPSLPRGTVYMEGRAIRSHQSVGKSLKVLPEESMQRSRRPSHIKYQEPVESSVKQPLPPSIELTTVPSLSRPNQSTVSPKPLPSSEQPPNPKSSQLVPTEQPVIVPLNLTIKELSTYIGELAQSSKKPAEFDNLKQLLFGEFRLLGHMYVHEIQKNGKVAALAILHPRSMATQRTIDILAFRLITQNEAELEPLLVFYLKYVWLNDPCERLCYVSHINDHSSAVPNCLTKLGYIEEPNKLGWRQLKSLCLTAERKLQCNVKEAEETTFSFELTEVLVDFTSSGICQIADLEQPDQFNCFEEVVCSELVRSTVQQNRMQLTKEKKNAIKHLSVKPAEVVKGKIAVHADSEHLNKYLEEVVLDPFDSFNGLGKIHLSVTRLYDSFGFDYLVENGSMYLKTDEVTSTYGKTQNYQYLVLKIPRGNMDIYLAIVDDTIAFHNSEEENEEPLNLRTRKFLEKTLNSDQYSKQTVNRTPVRLRLFRKHIYGRLADVDGRFSIFMRLRLNLTWTDYLQGAKRYGLKDPLVEFVDPFFAAILVKEGETYRTLVSTTIEEEDFLV